jgi:hypothetical protein
MSAAQERLAEIQEHLQAGGQVMVCTAWKATIYDKRHVEWFSATEKDLYVRRGKTKDCLNYTTIKFSKEG